VKPNAPFAAAAIEVTGSVGFANRNIAVKIEAAIIGARIRPTQDRT
jgi:hypothetical protein